MATNRSGIAPKPADVTTHWIQAVTAGSNELVAIVRPNGQSLHISDNGVAERFTGYSLSDACALRAEQIIHADDLAAMRAAFGGVAAAPGSHQTMSLRLIHRLGNEVRFDAYAANHMNDGVVEALVVRLSLGAERPKRTMFPEPQADVSDRAQLLAGIGAAIVRHGNDPTQVFSVFLLEVDRMTMLVGNYGQQVVDKLLAEVVQRLAGLLRPADMVAQIGSGEFGMLIHDTGKASEASAITDRIQETVSERYRIDGHTMTISAIIGIATSEREYADGEQVLRDAAVAASRARRQRRKRNVVFQTQMRVEDKRYMSLVDQLQNAVQQREFCLHYQPIIELDGRKLCGFEALVRWDHPSEGLVSPGEFIPVAEETGLIVALGQFVLEEACKQMAEWNRRYAASNPLSISVNLSPMQFAEEDLWSHIEHALRNSELDARQLNLEITESAVLENHDAAVLVLEKLKARGVRVSLDDFGTGYSSFSHLYQLPYDTLKIDRSFVARIGADGENIEIIHAIIALAHHLGLRVVAEGVETEFQATHLDKLGCEYAQGYYFARPLDARGAEALLSS